MLQQFTDGVNFGVGQLKTLDLCLGGSRPGQPTCCLVQSRQTLQHCFCWPPNAAVGRRTGHLVSCPQGQITCTHAFRANSTRLFCFPKCCSHWGRPAFLLSQPSGQLSRQLPQVLLICGFLIKASSIVLQGLLFHQWGTGTAFLLSWPSGQLSRQLQVVRGEKGEGTTS